MSPEFGAAVLTLISIALYVFQEKVQVFFEILTLWINIKLRPHNTIEIKETHIEIKYYHRQAEHKLRVPISKSVHKFHQMVLIDTDGKEVDITH